MMRYCPERKCVICGTKGHSVTDCPKKHSRKKKGIFQVTNKPHESEHTVDITAKINNILLTLLLDSGAGPSVLDLGTVHKLGLESQINKCPSRVYGIAKKPVKVIGNILLWVDLGDDQKLEQSFGVLQETATIRILGREFLKKFGSTEFDWDTQRIRLGSIWKSSDAILEGGDVMRRSHVASLQEDISSNTIENDRGPPVKIPRAPITTT